MLQLKRKPKRPTRFPGLFGPLSPYRHPWKPHLHRFACYRERAKISVDGPRRGKTMKKSRRREKKPWTSLLFPQDEREKNEAARWGAPPVLSSSARARASTQGRARVSDRKQRTQQRVEERRNEPKRKRKQKTERRRQRRRRRRRRRLFFSRPHLVASAPRILIFLSLCLPLSLSLKLSLFSLFLCTRFLFQPKKKKKTFTSSPAGA